MHHPRLRSPGHHLIIPLLLRCRLRPLHAPIIRSFTRYHIPPSWVGGASAAKCGSKVMTTQTSGLLCLSVLSLVVISSPGLNRLKLLPRPAMTGTEAEEEEKKEKKKNSGVEQNPTRLAGPRNGVRP